MKNYILMLVMFLIFISSYAVSISEVEAKRVALGLFVHKGGSPDSELAIDKLSARGQQADIYVINFKPTGFVILSGDDRAYPILAYSLTDIFPMNDLPDHVAWFIGEYQRTINEIRENHTLSVDSTWQKLRNADYSSFTISRDVAALLSTTWDQGWPYNSMCPADGSGPGGHVWAGCTATAMAQIMKRWNHPVTGNSSHSYTAGSYGTLSANFGASTYNWAAMPNSTSSVNSSISTLLYHCGVATNMDYSPTGSGAYLTDARTALVTYFRYNSGAAYYEASNYSTSTWASMLTSDLDLGRPILYQGYSPSSGHAWVLDGYQATNYFHFNWGWSGSYNGYFYLNNLNPGSYTFNQNQGAVMHIYPQQQGALQGTVTSNGIAIPGATVSLGSNSTITNTNGQYSFPSINSGNYLVSATKSNYNYVAEYVNIYAGQTTTLNFTLVESVYPPSQLSAVVAGSNVNLNWQAPSVPTVSEWICWGDGSPHTSLGWNVPYEFTVAQRWSPADLSQYFGGYLSQIKFYPCYSNATYTLKVWTGGTSNNPGTQVYSQVISNPSINAWNTVQLPSTINIPSSGDLWVGYHISTQGGYPAGCDVGPAINGKGNMIWIGGSWYTLYGLSASLNYNWLIQAYVTYSERSDGNMEALSFTSNAPEFRDLNGYNVWRLRSGQENNPSGWSLLNPHPISSTSYSDTGFSSQMAGTYKWAVRAVYTGGTLSDAAFSNAVVKSISAPNIPKVSITQTGANMLLTWPAVTTDINGSPLTGVQYKIYRHTSPVFTPSSSYLIATISVPQYTDINAASSVMYFYTVIAVVNSRDD